MLEKGEDEDEDALCSFSGGQGCFLNILLRWYDEFITPSSLSASLSVSPSGRAGQSYNA